MEQNDLEVLLRSRIPVLAVESLDTAELLAPCVLWVDEIFFVDLQNIAIRSEILKIHAVKCGITLEPDQLSAPAASTEGFVGAEIEQAVVATLYTARAKGVRPDAALLAAEIAATRPLEVIMAEKIAELREWADGRTVSAD